jgi:hypothetical protein
MYRRVLCLRNRLRSLRGFMPDGAGCENDGALHRAGYGLRASLPHGRQLHGTRQRVCDGNLRHVCRRVRRMRRRMRQASADGALPGMRGGMPALRRGMPAHGVRRPGRIPGTDDGNGGALTMARGPRSQLLWGCDTRNHKTNAPAVLATLRTARDCSSDASNSNRSALCFARKTAQ